MLCLHNSIARIYKLHQRHLSTEPERFLPATTLCQTPATLRKGTATMYEFANPPALLHMLRYARQHLIYLLQSTAQ